MINNLEKILKMFLILMLKEYNYKIQDIKKKYKNKNQKIKIIKLLIIMQNNSKIILKKYINQKKLLYNQNKNKIDKKNKLEKIDNNKDIIINKKN